MKRRSRLWATSAFLIVSLVLLSVAAWAAQPNAGPAAAAPAEQAADSTQADVRQTPEAPQGWMDRVDAGSAKT